MGRLSSYKFDSVHVESVVDSAGGVCHASSGTQSRRLAPAGLPLPLARYRAHGQLMEVRAVDLRFNALEAAEFLNQVKGSHTPLPDASAAQPLLGLSSGAPTTWELPPACVGRRQSKPGPHLDQGQVWIFPGNDGDVDLVWQIWLRPVELWTTGRRNRVGRSRSDQVSDLLSGYS